MSEQWQFLESDELDEGAHAVFGEIPDTASTSVAPASRTQSGMVRFMHEDFASGSLLPEPDFGTLPAAWTQQRDFVPFVVNRPGLVKTGQLVLWKPKRRKDNPDLLATVVKTHFALLNAKAGTGYVDALVHGRFVPCYVASLNTGDAAQPLFFYSSLRWNYKLQWWMHSPAQTERPEDILTKICQRVFSNFGVNTRSTDRLTHFLSALRERYSAHDTRAPLRKSIAALGARSINDAIRIAQRCQEAGLGNEALGVRFRPLFSPRQFVRWITAVDPRPIAFRTQMDVNEWKEILHDLDQPFLHLAVQRLEAGQPHGRPLAAALAILGQR